MDSEKQLSRHEIRELRREERKERRKEEEGKERKSKSIRKALTYLVAVLVIAGIGFGAYSLSINGNAISKEADAYVQSQLAAIPRSFIHWHADVDVIVCGEDRRLPEAPLNGLLGTHRMHTHDSITNAGSFPNSDGNGVLHNEGNFHEAPYEHTLGRFFQNIGIPLSKDGVFEIKGGAACPDSSQGTLKVFVNEKDATDPDFLYYIPRDGDRILVVYGPETSLEN